MDYNSDEFRMTSRNKELLELFAFCVNKDVNHLLPSTSDEFFSQESENRLQIATSVLLKSFDNVNFTDNNGQTFLHHFLRIYLSCVSLQAAKQSAASNIVSSLLNRGAAFHIIDNEGFSPLQLAVDNRLYGIVKLMLFKLDKLCLCFVMDCRKEHKLTNIMSPFHLDVASFPHGILKICIENRIQFTVHSSRNETLLIILCKYLPGLLNQFKALQLINKMVRKGCDVNSVDSNGYSALHYAVKKDNMTVVRHLIALTADVNLRARDYHTPFYLAFQAQNVDMMKILLKAGVNVDHRITGNITLLMAALIHFSSEKNVYYDQAKMLEIIKFLIHSGADVNFHDEMSGLRPLHIAALSDNPKVLNLIINKVANVNVQTKCGLTPLHLAYGRGCFKVIRRLIEFGADVNSREHIRGLTPLHMVAMGQCEFKKLMEERINLWDISIPAAIDYSIEHNAKSGRNYAIFTKLLLKAGADINVRDSHGWTPLHHAARDPDSWEMLVMLLQFGAYVNRHAADGLSPLHLALESFDDSALWLIRFGADLTDIDLEMIKQIPSYSEFHKYMTMINIAGLSAINACGPECDSYQRLYKNCSKEVKKLKNYLLEDGISLYDWLHKNHTRAPPFYLNGIPLELKSQFPLYYEIIQARYRYVRERIELLEPAKLAWNQTTEIHLPEDCIEHILFYLNNRHLHLLVDC